MASINANSPRDLLKRLDDMTIAAKPSRTVCDVRRGVASAVDLTTFQAQTQNGRRRLLKATEVLGLQ